MLGLPERVRVLLFDMDGVLTQTATLHAAAWKEMFDAYLRERATREGEPFRQFDAVADYEEYVDGRPRADGTRSFLESRGIRLSEGSPDDPADAETVEGLSNRKNEIVQRMIRDGGVSVYEGSMRYLRAARAAGFPMAVVTSSANAAHILGATGIADLVDTVVDGTVIATEHLPGKPAPDTFVAAAKRLGAVPAGAAVFEDALAGVEAGRAGHFAFVVGVDRLGQADALRAHGADIAVGDLAELLDAP